MIGRAVLKFRNLRQRPGLFRRNFTGLYVLVEAKKVRRIILCFEFSEPCVVATKCPPHDIWAFVAKVIQEIGIARIGFQRLRKGPRPGDVLITLGGIYPRRGPLI
jgi:hypothetical protein